MVQVTATFYLSTLNGGNGFRLFGTEAYDYSGASVTSAGDINGDGFDDILIGASGADQFAGESYVVFGKASGFVSALYLPGLNGSNGFRLEGGYRSGSSLSSAGDVNGDGFDDFLIGTDSESYLVFGKASGFGSAVDLPSLNGSNGFRIDGGSSVSSAGDVNGDGFDDMLIGASVVFGKASGFAFAFNLATLNGTNGFRLNPGGLATSAGDVNGDGFDDILLGASIASPNGVLNAGESYVVFGKASGFTSAFDLASLNGSNGFRLNGIHEGDLSGNSVSSAGDINNDGFDDIVIGAKFADPHGDRSGESYVVFGKTSGFAAALDLSALNGTNGFRLEGIGALTFSGTSVSSAGDVNGDGFADMLIGAPRASQTYVVYGKASGFAAVLDLAAFNGVNGFVIAGGDRSGAPVSAAGDVNNDGFDDILIGSSPAVTYIDDTPGSSYVIFGGAQIVTRIHTGTALGEAIVGNKANDAIYGLGGNDTLTGGAGNDTLDGGLGLDTASYAATGAVIVNLATGATAGAAVGDVLVGIENLIGSNLGGDVLFGSDGANVLDGLGGNDRLLGGGKQDTLRGGGGGDQLLGYAGSDALIGQSGNDLLYGASGNDSMTGGAGADAFIVDVAAFGNDNITDYEDGSDRIWFKKTVADALSDLIITGNSTTNVMVSVAGLAGQSILVHGATGITLTAADFAFFV